MLLDRQRDGAAAGAQVDDAGVHFAHRQPTGAVCRLVVSASEPQQFQRPFDQGFGVGPRYEHARIHLQCQSEELLLAHQIGQRLTCHPLLAQRHELRVLRRIEQEIAAAVVTEQ